MTLTLATLHVFPVKSCAPLAPARAEVTARGLAGDREWMLVDDEGRFVTGRQFPRTVLLRAQPTPTGLRLEFPGAEAIEVERPPADAARTPVTVWKDVVGAQHAHDADTWLAGALGRPLHLAYMDAGASRQVSLEYGRPGDIVSFADAYPLLLIGQGSLDGLNARLAAPLPMLRFRPNLVVAGAEPHAEDAWRRVRIGTAEFDLVKPCTRCIFTTIDPATGTPDPFGEPLATLKHYRRSPSGITFGQNLVPRVLGEVRVGDEVVVLD